MAKQKISYRCNECSYQSIKWIGCCPECKEWNSFIEIAPATLAAAGTGSKGTFRTPEQAQAVLSTLDQISIDEQSRMCTDIKEWDRVLGGGIVPGSFVILTGDPGIGKSTLLLQVADRIAQKHKAIYFSSEESLQQVKGRARRLGIDQSNLLFSDQSCLDQIIDASLQLRPAMVILDSIQSTHLSLDSNAIPGTIAQLREAAFRLMRFAKENGIAVLITGHITKEREMAGPKLLEHMVDAVFYLQGEDRWQTRILRSVKNRFGAINEVGFFHMKEEGLVEVTDINSHLLSDIALVPGSALVCSVEGSRPLLLELQALVVESKYGMPQRVVTGIDQKQVVLIAAILEKYLHIKFNAYDIFVKVSGGFKVRESSIDLGIALALLSSYFQQALPAKSVAIAEVSLTGQVKPTNQANRCIKEAEKFGLERILLAKRQQVQTTCQVIDFSSIYNLLSLFPEK
ncbi:MAG: DNA repair protein RadA [Epsilonproteobacteria bacterium]|nr:DNA repair protein RadA [Campylobacterota bacterium]